MRFRRAPKLIGILFCFCSLSAATQEQRNIWNSPAFSLPPAELLQIASGVPEPKNADVLVYVDDSRLALDATGKKRYVHRRVYKLLSTAGVQTWGEVSAQFAPWHEGRPSLQARVITPDAKEHKLDPRTIAESPVGDDSPDIYSDLRVLRAPLPALAVGAIVEEQISVEDTVPEFRAGMVRQFFVGRGGARIERTLVTISAPAALPIKYKTRLLPEAATTRTESDGRVIYRFENGPLEPIESEEPDTPGEVARWPQITIASGSSWQSVAAAYGEIVDRQLAAGDLSSIVRKVVGASKDREEIASRLLEFVHQQVRYTGVEFGDAALVPREPLVVLQRKYGDCKDTASLYTALLRQSGVPAFVALLSAGSGEDSIADMPGLGFFDHAIVYLPGTPDFWVDITDEFGRLGTLPIGDQGRLAMVVRRETTELIRTPDLPSSTNQLMETREFFLSEEGPARIIETTEPRGPSESTYRSYYGGPDTKEIQEHLKKYVKEIYLAEQLTALEHSADRDLRKPFQLRLEIAKGKRGYTGERDAVVGVPIGGLFGRLPSDITDDEPAAPKPRKHPYVLPETYVNEWKYRIVPPPGYRLRALPESESRQLGPATLTVQFSESKNGEVLGSVRFDTGNRRTLTVEEYEALQKAVREQERAEVRMVRFEQAGYALLESGKIRESLDEFRRLAALHPKESLHRQQVAKALLRGGLGEAARAEAKKAVALEPASATAYKTLAWVLEHDLLGRRLHKGFDYAGAEAAFRRALELDPADNIARGDLAILLEYDANGTRYGVRASLADAIKEYDVIKSKLNEVGLDNNLLFALMWARRFPELKTYARSLSSSASRNALLVVAVTATEGLQAAIAEATRLSSDNAARSKVLTDAAEQLLKLRLYTQSAEMFIAGAEGTANAAAIRDRAEMIRRARRHEELTLDGPSGAVKRLLIALMTTEEIREDFFDIFSRDTVFEDRKKALQQTSRTTYQLRLQIAAINSTPAVIADLTVPTMQPSLEGNDVTGYRLRVAVPGQSTQTFYVVKEMDRYAVLDGGEKPDSIGQYVLKIVHAGSSDRARVWLEWVRDEQKLGGGDDPLSGLPFPRFWSKGQSADAAVMELAAGALAAQYGNEAGMALLERRRATASSDAEAQNIDLALAAGYSAKNRFSDLLAVAERLTRVYPTSATAFRYLTNAYAGLQRWDDWETAGQARLKAIPDDPDAIRSLVQQRQLRGKYKEAMGMLRELIKAGKATVGDHNEFGWDAVLAGEVTDEALDVTRRGVLLSQGKQPEIIHTLACLYAESGKMAEARELLLKYMDGSGIEEPDDAAWLVFGRIAEEYGALDTARASYQRITAPEKKYTLATSSYVLAQRRLKSLPTDAVAKE